MSDVEMENGEIEAGMDQDIDSVQSEDAKPSHEGESLNTDPEGESTEFDLSETGELAEADWVEADQQELSEDSNSIEAEAINSEEAESDTSEGELSGFSSEEVEELENLEAEQIMSVIESVLFATDKPQGMGTFKQIFKGTTVVTADIKKAIEQLTIEYAGGSRGVTLEQTTGGYQIRTKSDNMTYLKRLVKGRPFKLSGPALEVISIVAYKQPCVKFQVDEIRGVESGHILRGLMDKSLVNFAGKSELPGKPMYYATTRKFLEIFGLRNLNELPSLADIDQLLPEGIEEQSEDKETLDQITDQLSKDGLESYSEAEDELEKITDKLTTISSTTDFFEQEKVRVREERDTQRANDIEETLMLEEEVSAKDLRWFEKYKAKKEAEAEALNEPSEEEEQSPGVSLTAEESISEPAESSPDANHNEMSELAAESSQEESASADEADSLLFDSELDESNDFIAKDDSVMNEMELVEPNDEGQEEHLASVEESEESSLDFEEPSETDDHSEDHVLNFSEAEVESEIPTEES